MKIFYVQDNKIAMLSPNLGAPIDLVESTIPVNSPRIKIDDDKIPSNDDLLDFFEAMQVNFNTGEISFDITLAREIRKNKLRIERIPFFEKNDLFLRDSILIGDQAAIDQGIVERNRLRNITTLADLANSLQELRNIKVE
jgi:hypothetical protein